MTMYFMDYHDGALHMECCDGGVLYMERTGKGKPCIVIDGSTEKGFKKWRKTTVHPTYLCKTMTAHELLVGGARGGGRGEWLGREGEGKGEWLG